MTDRQVIAVMAMIAYAADNISAKVLQLAEDSPEPAYKGMQDVCDEAVEIFGMIPKAVEDVEKYEAIHGDRG